MRPSWYAFVAADAAASAAGAVIGFVVFGDMIGRLRRRRSYGGKPVFYICEEFSAVDFMRCRGGGRGRLGQ